MPVVPMFNYFGYLFDGSSWAWSQPSSIPHLLVQHIVYTLLTVAISTGRVPIPISVTIRTSRPKVGSARC